MKTLHVAPGDSTGGSLHRAIRATGREDEVLSFFDDLSCGPIATGEPSERAEWWEPFYGDREIEAELKSFWDRIAVTSDRLVVWFGRQRASELALSLALADRLGERPYDIIDVTGLRFPVKRPDGSSGMGEPVQSVAMMHPDKLRTQFGSERPATDAYREECRRTWHRLQAENALFRIVTAAGLVSAPMDYFDRFILERVTTEWKIVARVVGDVIGYNSEPYIQVGDMMLQARLVALVEDGKLLADGDPWEMRACRVRLSP
jgi:uncharacterized protein DUF3658/uncharacterized protein DUF1835